MGWSAARKLRRAVDGLTRVLAIEVLTAARGLDLRAPLDARPPATGAVVAAAARPAVRRPGPDRYLAPEIEAAVDARRRRRRSSPPPSRSPARCTDHLDPTRTSTRDPDGRRPPRPRPARHHPDRPQLADRGPAADAA